MRSKQEIQERINTLEDIIKMDKYSDPKTEDNHRIDAGIRTLKWVLGSSQDVGTPTGTPDRRQLKMTDLYLVIWNTGYLGVVDADKEPINRNNIVVSVRIERNYNNFLAIATLLHKLTGA